MLPIFVGIVLLVIIITVIFFVKRKRSPSAAFTYPVPLDEAVPLSTQPLLTSLAQYSSHGELGVLYVPDCSSATASATIVSAVRNPTATAPNTGVTTAEPQDFPSLPTSTQECAPPTSTAATIPSPLLLPSEVQSVPVTDPGGQSNVTEQPSPQPPAEHTPEDPFQGGEEGSYQPNAVFGATEQSGQQ